MEKNELAQRLEYQNRKLSVLYDISLTVSRSLDLRTTLNDTLNNILAFMRADSGVIYVIYEETLELVPVAFHNLSPDVVRDLTENKVRVGECMCGSIAQFDCEVIIDKEASSDPRFTRETLKKEGMEFYAGLPLKSKGKVVGVLCVITHTPYVADPEQFDILRAATVPIGLAIENALIHEKVKEEVSRKSRHLGFEEIITTSPQMAQVLNQVRKILDVPVSVLIFGESGTGKELVARAIHFNSIRSERPFIAINCGALPESLLESELFGYLKGAFTGASTDKVGLLEAADGGTLFLDEVNSMSSHLQLKLLRFLQDRTLYKVGSTFPVSVDARVIAATNQSIEDAIQQGTFREDLYYRLNVVKLDIPPLRSRREDIPLLARYFILKYNKAFGKSIRGLSEQALKVIMDHRWPGNVRELENVIERAMIMADGHELHPIDLPAQFSNHIKGDSEWSLDDVEKDHIAKVLAFTRGEMKRAAEILGINPTTLWRKLKKSNTTNNSAD